MTFLDLSESDIKTLSEVYNREITHEEKTNELSEEFGVAPRTIRSWWQKLGITGSGEKSTSTKVDEEDDLVTEEYEETPYDTLVLKSVWETQGKGGVTKVLRSWKNNTTGQDIKRFREELVDEIKVYSPTKFKPFKKTNSGGNLALISFPDFHIGRESVEDSEKLYQKSIEKSLHRLEGKSIDRVLYILGNDWFNVDTAQYTTTKGTQQKDVDDFDETLRGGVRIALDSIENLKSLGVPIDVIVVRGNHDFHRSVILDIAIEAYFRNDSQVNIDTGLETRKYYSWSDGNISFMFEHGELKNKDYGPIFATEKPKLWGNSVLRYCFLAHYHHLTTTKESRGVEINYLPSLAKNSGWEDKQGYFSERRGLIYIYDEDEGEIERLQIKV